MDREKAISSLTRLADSQQGVEVLVVGGGATGTGVALDAASRGLVTALVEADDFASGTSSRSTKLIHGGVRYLELAVKQLDRGQYKLVREALHERATLLRIAPHLVKPIALVTPVYHWREAPYYMTGLRLYDWIAGKSGLQKSYFLGSEEARERFPMLKSNGLRGGVVYHDGQFNDARMAVTLALTASEAGALVANHVAVESLLKKDGRVAGARVVDRETGRAIEIPAKVVINATGPFVDSLRRMDDPAVEPLLKASSGAHIVLDKRFSPPDMGLLIPKTEDGRVLFLLPWLGHTLVGTTDHPAPIEENPKPSVDDIEYILRQLKKYFALSVGRNDILSAWSGLRPLVSDPKAADTAHISRDHTVNVSPSGLVTITGGKWTTYRLMASDTVDHAIQLAGLQPKRKISTKTLLLAGAEGFSPSLAAMIASKYDLPFDTAQSLSDAYGDRAYRVAELARSNGLDRKLAFGHPYLEAEVVYGAKEESARSAADILARRTRLAFLDRKAAKDALPRIVELLAETLQWDGARKRREIAEAEAYFSI